MTRPLAWHDPTGRRMPFVRIGAGEGPPLVIVPGLGDGLAPLTEAGAPDALPAVPGGLDGHGFLAVSFPERLAPGATTADLADDLAAFLTAEVDGPVVLVAHSMGGMVAQHLAVRRADLVAGMVLSSSSAHADAALSATLRRWSRWLDEGDWRRFYRDAAARSYTGTLALRRRLATAVGPVHRPSHLVERHRALTQACVAHDACDQLAAIEAPTRILVGTADVLTPPRHARALAAAIRGAQLHELAGLGHGFPEQAPARFVANIADFLAAQVCR